MSQYRLFSALLSLAAVSGASFGIPQASHATEVVAASSSSAQSGELQMAQAQVAQAQSDSSTTRTLYVTGVGQVSAPADQAVMILSFYPNSYYSGADYSDPSSPPAQPQVQPSDLSTATEAATSAGASSVKASPDLTTPGSMRVQMTLNQPTQDKIEQVLNAVSTAVVKTNRYTSSGVTVGYTVRDCASLESRARQAAMTDATARANALAAVSGTQVGELISVSESVSWGTSYSSICPSADDPAVFADLLYAGSYYTSTPPVVRVTNSLSTTYGMK